MCATEHILESLEPSAFSPQIGGAPSSAESEDAVADSASSAPLMKTNQSRVSMAALFLRGRVSSLTKSDSSRRHAAAAAKIRLRVERLNKVWPLGSCRAFKEVISIIDLLNIFAVAIALTNIILRPELDFELETFGGSDTSKYSEHNALVIFMCLLPLTLSHLLFGVAVCLWSLSYAVASIDVDLVGKVIHERNNLESELCRLGSVLVRTSEKIQTEAKAQYGYRARF